MNKQLFWQLGRSNRSEFTIILQGFTHKVDVINENMKVPYVVGGQTYYGSNPYPNIHNSRFFFIKKNENSNSHYTYASVNYGDGSYIELKLKDTINVKEIAQKLTFEVYFLPEASENIQVTLNSQPINYRFRYVYGMRGVGDTQSPPVAKCIVIDFEEDFEKLYRNPILITKL